MSFDSPKDFIPIQAEKNDKQEETEAERNSRFSQGKITEEEIQSYWQDPGKPLFEHEILNKTRDKKTKFKLKGISEEMKASLLEETKDSWDEISFSELQDTLERFFEQKRSGKPSFVNVEYYVAEDEEGKPIAMTGIYTLDIDGSAGLELRKKIQGPNHNLVMGLGWFSVSKDKQGSGMGSYLLDWTENLAGSRGAKIMVIGTDEYDNSQTARHLYEKRGYVAGLDIEDYFGPGRDLKNYYANVSGEKKEAMPTKEKIDQSNRQEVENLAAKIFSPERSEELKACLDLIFEQGDKGDRILDIDSLILRDNEGNIESFAIYYEGLYQNVVVATWLGWKPENASAGERVLAAAKNIVKDKKREILRISGEGKNEFLLEHGFLSGNEGIPGMFEKGDDTKYIQYSKKL